LIFTTSAQLLRERKSDRVIDQAIQKAGKKPVSDGISTDAEGNYFITNLKDNEINKLSTDGKLINPFGTR
jgi:sugar lactone lactonase YvrE